MDSIGKGIAALLNRWKPTKGRFKDFEAEYKKDKARV